MVVGGGIFISRDTAAKLAEILDLSKRICDQLGGPDYLGPSERLEVKLHRALISAAIAGLTAEGIKSCLKEDAHE